MPQPLSPTSPSVSPRAQVKLASVTARTVRRDRPPPRAGKLLRRRSHLRAAPQASATPPWRGSRRHRARPRSGLQHRAAGAASGDGMPAARREATAGRRMLQVRRQCPRSARSGALRSSSIPATQASSAARIGMARRVEQRVDVGALDDAAGVHDQHVVRHRGDDAEVVRDQQQRRIASPAADRAAGAGSWPARSRRAPSSARRR